MDKGAQGWTMASGGVGGSRELAGGNNTEKYLIKLMTTGGHGFLTVLQIWLLAAVTSQIPISEFSIQQFKK